MTSVSPRTWKSQPGALREPYATRGAPRLWIRGDASGSGAEEALKRPPPPPRSELEPGAGAAEQRQRLVEELREDRGSGERPAAGEKARARGQRGAAAAEDLAEHAPPVFGGSCRGRRARLLQIDRRRAPPRSPSRPSRLIVDRAARRSGSRGRGRAGQRRRVLRIEEIDEGLGALPLTTCVQATPRTGCRCPDVRTRAGVAAGCSRCTRTMTSATTAPTDDRRRRARRSRAISVYKGRRGPCPTPIPAPITPSSPLFLGTGRKTDTTA